LYAPSFQKTQAPQVGSYSTGNQGGNYNFGGNLSNQDDGFNGSKYQAYQPSIYEASYQGVNYSSSLGGLNTNQPSSKGNLDNDYSYKYTSTSYGNTGLGS